MPEERRRDQPGRVAHVRQTAEAKINSAAVRPFPAPFDKLRAGSRAILSLPKDDGDAPRLVGGEHLGLHGLRFGCLAVHVRQRLPVGVAHDIAVRRLVGAPGRQEAA